MKRIEELYTAYSKKIYNYFYFLTYDPHKAEDLTQETFYQAVVSIPRFSSRSSVSTWLYAIARNTYLKSLREKKKETLELHEDIETRSTGMDPEEIVLRKDRAEAIRACIHKLPEQYATVLILKDREDLSYEEIGKITGMSYSSVKITIYRARKRFREEFTAYERGE
jgi:RNA polymerase sigma-70 factor, ECF subfamily